MRVDSTGNPFQVGMYYRAYGVTYLCKAILNESAIFSVVSDDLKHVITKNIQLFMTSSFKPLVSSSSNNKSASLLLDKEW